MQNPNLMEPVSKSDWSQWKQSHVTKALVYDLLEKRKQLLEDWSEGRFANDKEEQITKGRIQQLKDTIEYIISDFDYISEEQKSGN